jgi:hypothetical protein
VTVGPGFAPGLLTPTPGGAGRSRAPAAQATDTAGGEFHPALRTLPTLAGRRMDSRSRGKPGVAAGHRPACGQCSSGLPLRSRVPSSRSGPVVRATARAPRPEGDALWDRLRSRHPMAGHPRLVTAPAAGMAGAGPAVIRPVVPCLVTINSSHDWSPELFCTRTSPVDGVQRGLVEAATAPETPGGVPEMVTFQPSHNRSPEP